MSHRPQFSTNDVQKSLIVSQFIYLHETGSRKPPSTSELRQLQEELELISARATSRSKQLHDGQKLLKSRVEGILDNLPNRKRDASTAQATGAAPGTATPSADHPISKRIRPNTLAGGKAGGSDSESSTKTSSIRGGTAMHGTPSGSNSGRPSADGKHFQRSSYENSPTPQPPKAKHSSGTPVQDDFSRVKVTNQVQIQTYWASLEPYFRSIVDDDISFLEDKTDNQESYVVPRLGRFYAHVWAEEEIAHFPDHMQSNKTRHVARYLSNAETRSKGHAYSPAVGTNPSDPDMSLNTSRLAPLTERIISALVAERILHHSGDGVVKAEVDGGDVGMNGSVSMEHISDSDGSELDDTGVRLLPPVSEDVSLEDRLKRELQYVGILDDQGVNWDDREDDEVCVAIRSLQRQLRDQVRINRLRKERLLPTAREHIGYQEFTQVIDELDKQVEQSYLKRHRQTKTRKRKSTPVKTVALSDNAINSIDRRRRVIQAIGHLFPAEKFTLPNESIFGDIPDNPELNTVIP
ncbi:Transcriptional regulator [Coemansia sp. RSA 1933]|nr:Transcriptional regulator [Coemansia sp. RSA 1933]